MNFLLTPTHPTQNPVIPNVHEDVPFKLAGAPEGHSRL